MDFMTVKEASMLWNMDVSRIGKLLKEGRIPGAEKTGGHWYIPKGAVRPIDRRTRQGTEQAEPCFFRFPLLVNKDENQFYPPLAEDEAVLRQAQVDFFAFEFEKSFAGFRHLEEHTESVYVRICALFFECCLAWTYQKGKNLKVYLHKLKQEFKRDFPYKREMELVFPWLFSLLGFFESASKYLTVDPCYNYHPSVCPLLSCLSILHNTNANLSTPNLGTYVILCKLLEQDGFFYEAQELHIVLFNLYTSMAKEDAACYHLKKGLDIAMEHNLLIIPACYEFYYPNIYHTVLQDYPKEFAEKVAACSAYLHNTNAYCTASYGITDMYNNLSANEFQYILFAVQGFKYSEIAGFMDISERTVASKYSTIFEKLNIKSKKELIHIFRRAASGDMDDLSTL